MPKHRRDIIKFTPPLKNKITPINAGIKIIESRRGYAKSTRKLPLTESDPESTIIIKDGINNEIEIKDIPTSIFFEICFANGFK